MDVRKIIGWNVRALRVELGISQERLALEANMDRAYLGRIERGEENVTVARLEALATILKVSVATLFNEPEKMRPLPGLKAGAKPKKKLKRLVKK